MFQNILQGAAITKLLMQQILPQQRNNTKGYLGAGKQSIAAMFTFQLHFRSWDFSRITTNYPAVSAESSRSACISSPLAPNRQINVFPGDSVGKESTCKKGDVGSIPGSGRYPGERKWQSTPVFLPGKFHGQRTRAGYSLWGCKSQTWLSD